MTIEHKKTISALGFISFLLLFGGAALLERNMINANTYLWIQAIAIFIGLFILATSIEKLVTKKFSDFKSSAIWWAAAIAILAFYSRICAMEDINNLFHIDPTALPMSLLATQFMRFFKLIEWPFIILSFSSALILILIVCGGYFSQEDSDEEKISSSILVFSNFINCALCALFIHYHLDDVGRKHKIYLIAHTADFSSKFHCQGIDENKFSVLFIGPEQKKVLVAPKIPKASFFNSKGAGFLQALAIPTEFPILDCTSSMDFNRWKNDLL